MVRKVAFFLLVCGFCFFGCQGNESLVPEPATGQVPDTTGLSLSCLEDLHVRRTMKTNDLSLIRFINSNPDRPDSARNVIYLQPLGNMSQQVERILKDEIAYLVAFFQLDVKLLNRISFDDIQKTERVEIRMVPDEDQEYYGKFNKDRAVNLREQIEANSLIDEFLVPIIPSDCIALLGITEHDIYKEGYNYLFGISRADNNLGLVSTYRMVEDTAEAQANIRKVISKQIANIFAGENVEDYVCLMNYHNHIDALRKGVYYLSPRALEKLKYCIGFDYEKRFTDLRNFWRHEENAEMTLYYEQCLDRFAQCK